MIIIWFNLRINSIESLSTVKDHVTKLMQTGTCKQINLFFLAYTGMIYHYD